MRNSNTSHSLIATAVLASCASNLWAIDPNRAMSQYLHDQWGPDEGLPRGSVYSIAQTPDGYLWIGAEAGLMRFDGWKFRVISDGSTRPVTVFGLTPDRDGNLWVRLPGPRMMRFRSGLFTNPLAATRYTNITASAQGADGTLLASAPEQGTIAYRGEHFEILTAAKALPRSSINAIAQTSDGAVWIGTRDAGLFRIAGGQISTITKGLPDPKVNCLLAGANGELWIGTDNGAVRWNGSEITEIGLGSARPRVQVLALARDRDGNLWVGTDSRGLLRINAHGISSMHVGSVASANDAVTSVFEDREGSVWIGSGSGLERLRDSPFLTYSRPEGLPSDGNSPIFVDAANRLWFAPSDGGLAWLANGEYGRVNQNVIGNDVVYAIAGGTAGVWLGRQRGGLTNLQFQHGTLASKTYTQRDGLTQNSVYSVYESRDGAVWAGTLSGGVSRWRDGRFTTYTTDNGLASNSVSAIIEDTAGSMWFATPDGLSSYSRGHWQTYAAAEGLPSNAVNCVLAGSGGILWAGTAAGLAFRNRDRFQTAAGGRAVLGEPVFGIVEDRFGSLWVTTSQHVLRINRDHLIQGILNDRDLREYGAADGLRGAGGVKRQSSVVSDGRGRIWLSTNRGISVIDSGRLNGRSAPALVHVQSIAADGDDVDLRGPVRIPPGRKRIALAYTATILARPERIRFRYWLSGFDHGWSESVSAREAVYTNLGPGSYRFRVCATNSEGVFDSPETDVDFEIEPALWQAFWFQAGVTLIAGLGCVALYRLRLQRITRQLNLRYEERLAERTRIAQEIHDTLLQGFVSASMQLHVASYQVPPDSPAKPALERVSDLMRQVIDEGRNTIRGLRSPDAGAGDLDEAFSRIPRESGLEQHIEFRMIIEGQVRPLNPLLRDDIYRIGREALVNAFRHSQADSVEMEIEYGPKRFRLLIRDNGRGIDEAILQTGRGDHWGLQGMRERAFRIGGSLKVWSRHMAGTEVEFSAPNRIAFAGAIGRDPARWLAKFSPRRTPGNRMGEVE